MSLRSPMVVCPSMLVVCNDFIIARGVGDTNTNDPILITMCTGEGTLGWRCPNNAWHGLAFYVGRLKRACFSTTCRT